MKRFWLVCAVVVVIAAVTTLRVTHLDVLLKKAWTLNRQPMPEMALELGRYRADIQSMAIEGLEEELSALTYNADRDSLFAVTNDPPQLVELSLEGKLLRRISIVGMGDLEGLEYLGDNWFAIAEERSRQIFLTVLAEDAVALDAARMPSTRLDMGDNGNKGLEGLAWDAERRRLFAVKERDPLRLLVVTGFGPQKAEEPLAVEELHVPDEGLFMRDLSSLTYVQASGHLLLLSDQSNMLVEYDRDLRAISLMGLWPGMSGLHRRIPQAEGVAVDGQGRLFIVSEPNLFYRFVPKPR